MAPPTRWSCSVSMRHSTWRHSRPKGCGRSLARRREAPDDDRIWLGRAFLATLSGRFDEAGTWLDLCERRRPDDPAVWTARLDWAMAAGRDDEVHRALARLPADNTAASRVLAVRGWLAARRGEPEVERQALMALVEHDPGRIAALERLADLAYQVGQADQAAALRRARPISTRPSTAIGISSPAPIPAAMPPS